ncbi:MAG TPA: hypothetical protein PK299_07625 [Anaerolineales bacterium]|nr:hypothetical protein [Anaerolineales bacterium]
MKNFLLSLFLLAGLAMLVSACVQNSRVSAEATAAAQKVQNAFAQATADALAAQNNPTLPPAEATSVAQSTLANAPTSTVRPSPTVPVRDNSVPPEISSDLQRMGIDPTSGVLEWQHPPITLFAEGKNTFDHGNNFLLTVVTDFVIAADVTWNTLFGTAGCGYFLRSDGKTDDNNNFTGNQYMLGISRAALGVVGLSTMRNGQIDEDRDETVQLEIQPFDPSFQFQNDTTNHFAIIGRDDVFSVYSNGNYVGDLSIGAGFLKGFVGFLAINESGNTTCTFNNAYLYTLPK